MLEFKIPEVAEKFVVVGDVDYRLEIPVGTASEKPLTMVTLEEANYLRKNGHHFIADKKTIPAALATKAAEKG